MADADAQVASLLQMDGTLVQVNTPAWLALGLSWGAPLCSVALTVAGVSTLLRIRRQRSVGQLSIVPFLSLLLNCTTWTLYGLLQHDLTILAPNLLGAFLGLLYSVQYVIYAGLPSPATSHLASSSSSSSSASPISALSSAQLAAHVQTQARRQLMGTLAALLGVCMLPVWLGASAGGRLVGRVGAVLATLLLASPLVSLRTVLRDRHTGSMPALPTSLASFACAASWAAYGWLVAGDVNVVVPNLLGLFAATFQLLLFAVFPAAPPDPRKRPKVWA
jgi:solute carrier family 50 (sugar transporter)